MKKLGLIIMTLVSIFALGACAMDDIGKTPGEVTNNDVVEISLWSFPIGEWSDNVNVSSILAAFNKQYPNIRVTATAITYETGDAEVEKAIADGKAPDIVFEGPERLVANWGERGLMADISDLFSPSDRIIDRVKAACRGKNGYNIYPICMTTHCMAINRDMFEKADAWQYVTDKETHTWTTEDFVSAVDALSSHGVEKVVSVYCKGQGGDQGTRALVNNLYGGTFVNEAHTEYTVNSEENIRALELLYSLKDKGVVFDAEAAGGDAINEFLRGETAMTLCWNISSELTRIKNSVQLDFDIYPIAFPSEGEPALQGGIWGMGIFDNGDPDKIEAAKTFIRFIARQKYDDAVIATGYLPVVEGLELYINDELREEYGVLSDYLGDYYQISENWQNARTAWWNMLKRIGSGEDISSCAKDFDDEVNRKGGK